MILRGSFIGFLIGVLLGAGATIAAFMSYAAKKKVQRDPGTFGKGAFRNWGYEVAREEFGELTATEEELWEKHGGEHPVGKVMIKDRIADAIGRRL